MLVIFKLANTSQQPNSSWVKKKKKKIQFTETWRSSPDQDEQKTHFSVFLGFCWFLVLQQLYKPHQTLNHAHRVSRLELVEAAH